MGCINITCKNDELFQLVGLFLARVISKPLKPATNHPIHPPKSPSDLVGRSFLHESHFDDADEPGNSDAKNGVQAVG